MSGTFDDFDNLPDVNGEEVTSGGQGENIQVVELDTYDNGQAVTGELNTNLSRRHDAAVICYNNLDDGVFKGPAADTSREGIDKFVKTVSDVLIPTYQDISKLLGSLKSNDITHDAKAFQTVNSAFEDRMNGLPEIGKKGPKELEFLTVEGQAEEAFRVQLLAEDIPEPPSRIDQTFASLPISKQLQILHPYFTNAGKEDGYELLTTAVTKGDFKSYLNPSFQGIGLSIDNFLQYNPAKKGFDPKYNILTNGMEYNDFINISPESQLSILQAIYNQQSRIKFPTQ